MLPLLQSDAALFAAALAAVCLTALAILRDFGALPHRARPPAS